jgi:hypothetical protein
MTDTSKTREQLIDMAGDELTISNSSNALEAEDQQKLDSRFDGLMADLSARGIVTIADDQDIPIEWCGPLAELLANECARIFGKEKMPDQMREGVEDRLRVITSRGDISTYRLKMEAPVKSSGYGLSLARWTSGG